MRKTLITAAVLLCVCVIVFSAATVLLMPVSEDVAVTQTFQHGDPAAAQGLDVNFRCQYSHVLYWDIYCDPVTVQSETDFIFSINRNDPFYIDRNTYGGFEVYSLLDYRSHIFQWNKQVAAPEDAPILQLNEALDALPVSEDDGEDTVHTIDLSDYYEYYPLEGRLESLFDFSYFYSYSEYRNRADDFEKKLSKLINNYFKIPVRDNALVNIAAYAYPSGERDYHVISYPDDSTFFFPETYSFLSGDSCYFVFSSAQGHDISLIPGGWGIYRLDYTTESGGFSSAKLSTVFPLDPSTKVSRMSLSANGKILLETSREQGTFLTVIDFSSMETLQELQLSDDPQPADSQLIIGEDYIVTLHNSKDLFVYQQLEDGTYEPRIDIDISAGGYVPEVNFYREYGIAFDGEKLAIANILRQDVEKDGYIHSFPLCGFTLSVYDNTGLLYYGEYDTSLSPVNTSGDMYGKYIYAYYSEPLILTWE